jgi:hypothetical protein
MKILVVGNSLRIIVNRDVLLERRERRTESEDMGRHDELQLEEGEIPASIIV